MTGHDERVAQAMAEHEEERGAFASLSIVGYRRLWFAGTFAFMSVQMQFLLRGVLAWDLTEREGALGLIYLCFGTTMLFATPLGGVASDRIANRKVLLVSQTVLFAGALGMGIVVVTGVVQFWMLAVASVAQGLAFGFYGPARIVVRCKTRRRRPPRQRDHVVDAEPERHPGLRTRVRRNARRYRVLRYRRRLPRERRVLGRCARATDALPGRSADAGNVREPIRSSTSGTVCATSLSSLRCAGCSSVRSSSSCSASTTSPSSRRW